jgi:hypothetical protein
VIEADRPALWVCPRCGVRLVSRNLWHSCGSFTLEALFANATPGVLELARQLCRSTELAGRRAGPPAEDQAGLRSAGPICRVVPPQERIPGRLRPASLARQPANRQNGRLRAEMTLPFRVGPAA